MLDGNGPAHSQKKELQVTQNELKSQAGRPGSENGPLGLWTSARLAQRPEAGQLVQVNGSWYVAVAGVRQEGYRGDYGGLYARWVQVPREECADW